MNVSQGNQQVAVSWDLAAGALSYSVQRSSDGVNYSVVASPGVNKYLDTTIALGTQYYYQVASTNASGTSGYTSPQSVIPAPVGEMSLGELRLRAQQRADRVNSKFVTTTEWNSYINQSALELYDMLVTAYEDYFKAPSAAFVTDGTTYIYPLPNGSNSFIQANNISSVSQPFYKLLGVDLALNGQQNSYVTLSKYNFIDRNKYLYQNSGSTIYGRYNMQYRLMGANVEFIPVPSAGQTIRLEYIPRLASLLQDTDITTIGFSGWLEYVIVKAAYLALTKEESDTSSLVLQLQQLAERIAASAMSRDAGMPDTISDTKGNGWYNGNGNMGGNW